MTKKVIRRTKTISEILEQNTKIVTSRLGRTRSQSKLVKPSSTKASVPVLKKKIQKIKNKKQVVVEKQKVDLKKEEKSPAQKKEVPKKTAKESKKSHSTVPLKKGKVEATIVRRASSIKAKAMEEEEQLQKKEIRRTDSKASKQGEKLEQLVQGPRKTKSRATAGIVDVVFCLDTTSSMGIYIAQSKQTVKTIIKNISEKSQDEEISVKFGFVCYRDHPPQDHTYVTKVMDLCDEKEIITFIDAQDACGGGDYPEAVLDGLLAASKEISWRENRKIPSLRYIFHIADAPPHGKEYGQVSQWSNGVPSGVTLDKVTYAINIREIHYRLINLNQINLKLMADLFKGNFTNYDETTLENAKDLNIRICDMIIRELLPDVDYTEA